MTLVKPMQYKILLLTSALAFAGAGFCAAAEIKADVKPALDNKELNEEQLRLAKLIHKKIVDYKAIKQKTHNGKAEKFEAYTENMASGEKFDLKPIKGGKFTWKGEKEGDVLEVTLSSFWMASKEITWEQYEPFMLSKLPRQKNGQLLDFMRDQIKSDIEFISRPTPPYHPMTFGMKRDGHPAISMTQHAAIKYCQWLSFQTGHFYRLPTEAEWEFACKGGGDAAFSWGNDPKKASDYAWLAGDDSTHYNAPGKKKPNAFGLYDMHGNVLEWTLDQYVTNRKEHFGKDKVTDPWVKATKPYPHVTKGGHWKSTLDDAKSAARHQSTPKWKQSDPQFPKSQWYHTDTPFLGFRVVRPEKIPTVEEMYHYWNSGVAEDDL